MADILLTTLNARYAHSAFGLRYLMANLGPLAERARILEFDINQRTSEVLEAILAEQPKIVGLGVYIWNAEPATRLVADLKRLSPQTFVVLGGPEVSYEADGQPIVGAADYVISGEADLSFAQLCTELLAGRLPPEKMIAAPLPHFATTQGPGALSVVSAAATALLPALQLPYDLYTDEDIAHRVIYVEASRGCPFKCEFCLSSLDIPVRNAPLDEFLNALDRLIARGARQFKFVDRTFNLNLKFSRQILEFFLSRYEPGFFIHFEMIPDRLPEALREVIAKFPAGALQFEVGVQTFNDEVSARISRRQDNAKLAENLTFLRDRTGVHVHADLIVGLPGETIESFAKGFDRLVGLRPQEIQVGILKRLRGTPIIRHDAEFGMAYSAHPPYEILQNNCLNFETLQRLRRFSRYWDLIANSGNFARATAMIWASGASPFWSFLDLSDALHAQFGRQHAIALLQLAESLFLHLTRDKSLDGQVVAEAMWADITLGGRRDGPEFLRPWVSEEMRQAARRKLPPSSGPARQARHAATAHR